MLSFLRSVVPGVAEAYLRPLASMTVFSTGPPIFTAGARVRQSRAGAAGSAGLPGTRADGLVAGTPLLRSGLADGAQAGRSGRPDGSAVGWAPGATTPGTPGTPGFGTATV